MILIVDDKPENIFALKKLLEVNNFEVETALSGEEALKKVLKNIYSLIILDVQMPGMDGFEVAEAISGFNKAKDIPIIFLSAVSTDKKFIIKGYSSGGIDYVTKPVDPDILLLKVKTFHRLSQQTRELNEIHQALQEEMEVRKKTQFEQYLKTKELKSILETIPQITFTANAVGNIEFVNEQWYVYSDYKHVFPEVYSKELPVPRFWQNIIISQPQLPLEVCLMKQYNNEYRYHLLSLIPVKEEEAIVKWVGTFTDIHEQKLNKDLLEKRVVERTAELIAANNKLVLQNDEKEKRAAELIIANRLYSFLSQINHTIVHSEDEQTVFNEACRIAVDIGKYEMAWISILDQVNKKSNHVAYCNISKSDLELFDDLSNYDGGPTAYILKIGKRYVINDFEPEPENSNAKKYALLRGLKSGIALPIIKSGEMIGVYNLFSSNVNSFSEVEIALLEEVTRDISFALDIFEKEKLRKVSENKLIHSELRLKQAQAIAHIGSWEKNISTGNELWSEETCRIYGLPETENKHTYESWKSFIHPEDMDDVMKIVKEAQKKGSNSAYYYRIKRKDGTVRYIYAQSHFEFNEKGKAIAKYGVEQDVTETKEAEKSLAQSEANLRLIMDSIPLFISTRNIDGKYLFVNKSFADLMGITQKELLEKYLSETFPVKSEAEYYTNQDREVILSGEMITNPEHFFTDYNGNKRIFSSIKIPFTVAGTNEKAVLGITSEITEQKIAYEERTKMIADIVQRNKDLEQFSYIVSHNLRAPVANIIGLADVMQFDNISEEDKKVFIGDLSFSVKKLDDVIKDLNKVLQVKIEVSGKKESVKFSDLLEDIKLSIDNLVRSEAVLIRSDFSAIDEMVTLKGYLYSIFFNLISNSIKYRQPNVELVIDIKSYKTENKFRIVLKDNGLGIDLLKRKDQVFGLYKRFHPHIEGKGIGLYMVKTQVETLGGTISVISEVNKGTEFIIEFENNLK